MSRSGCAGTSCRSWSAWLNLRSLVFSNDRRGGGGQWISQRNNYPKPAARVLAAVVVLGDVGRDVGLRYDRAKVVTDQPPEGELALLQVGRDRPVEIARAETH